jgi:hypothetical protein
MNDSANRKRIFLDVVRVKSEEEGIRESINSAVATRGGGKVYATDDLRMRTAVKKCWRELMREEAELLFLPKGSSVGLVLGTSVTDASLCGSIRRIAASLSSSFAGSLYGSKLRYGVAQKGFNLYLKNLWCLGRLPSEPPHCPVDGVVLKAAGIDGSWAKCDDEMQYVSWIGKLRTVARLTDPSLSEWESRIWLEDHFARGRKDRDVCSG